MKFQDEATNDCEHPYSIRECSECGQEFCWSCCGGTNVHEGGKYEEDYMYCPKCGHDIEDLGE